MIEHRRKLYGRRKGPKLSPHQERLLETLLPELALALEEARDPKRYFAKAVDDVWLEIGFGAGEHLLWQAAHHPNVGLIGAEPYTSGVAKLLSKLAAGESAPANIRLYSDDARNIIDALPDASLGRVFLLFPDPWPKTRHHKRRFVQTETLDQLARVMKQGAEFRFASDDAGYLTWTLERLTVHPAFQWTATRAEDWHTRTADWPQTRYEAKELHGKPAFLRFVRC
ncbi:MAG TPA: tRNA (guanine(46)-N(7))-methyltransferase TrmB [Rhizomicrobium sp.]|nr:tRNA (guanine(46)-N(7))-methyltransferase TrmB [Rhizomicrobium sp.]